MTVDTIFELEEHAAVEPFVFDQRVVSVFDDMVSRSVPGYATIQLLTADLAIRFLRDGWIYDLGCSTGTTIKALLQRANTPLKIVGVDTSGDMLEKARAKLEDGMARHQIELVKGDIGDPRIYNQRRPDVVIMNLVLQFTRPLIRKSIIKQAFENLGSGGCFLLVEKTIQEDPFINSLFIDYYHEFKKHMGYSDIEISKKREALENRLIPFFLRENADMLTDAGFAHVSTFFQWMNFTGILAVKD